MKNLFDFATKELSDKQVAHTPKEKYDKCVVSTEDFIQACVESIKEYLEIVSFWKTE